ncbi:NHL repeat-containing protein 2 [Planctomycetales bacterium 10988]|nr:NHL repeat-containing protein 2 [Planctomycetales bacterium 10988]
MASRICSHSGDLFRQVFPYRTRTKWAFFSLILFLGCCIFFLGCGHSDSLPEVKEVSERPVSTTDSPLLLAQADQDTPKAQAGKAENAPMLEHPFPNASPAPNFGSEVTWLNTAGPLELRDLKGKFVILDFWTYCCINCMHILPELKKLEHAYPESVVVIGVHSAKFEQEKDTESIRNAILRYDIEHPVINDAEMKVWRSFGCNSWPSLRVIDPEGNLVAGHSGEIEFEVLNNFLKRAIPYYRQAGKLNEKPLHFDVEKMRRRETSPLYYPGKVLADAKNDRLFIADSNHDRLVISSLDGQLQAIIGTGQPGLTDGNFETAQFHDPQGMALLGETLYVADTANHAIRKIDLKKQEVKTISGTGEQRRGPWPGVTQSLFGSTAKDGFYAEPKGMELNSPWDLLIHGDYMYIAMAGPHQIWRMDLEETEMGVYAGNGREDITDGPLVPERPYTTGYSSFAQPSGFATDGKWLYIADSEGSSIRAVPFDPEGEADTILGTDQLPGGRLFAFGDIDGKYPDARLQHPLGVAYHDGAIYIADTYNNKIKALDVKTQTVKTLFGSKESGDSDEPPRFFEPAGLDYAEGKLYIADTNNHLIRVIDLETKKVSTLAVEGLKPPKLPAKTPATVAAVESENAEQAQSVAVSVNNEKPELLIDLKLNLPKGFKINDLAPMQVRMEEAGTAGLVDTKRFQPVQRIQIPLDQITVSVPFEKKTGKTEIELTWDYFYCSKGKEGICKVGSATWTIPVELTDGSAEGSLQLTQQVQE